METSKIREVLTQQRALYLRSLQESEELATKIRRAIDSVSPEDRQILTEKTGLDYEVIARFDLERMKTDKEYLKECKEKQDVFIKELHEYLEAGLDV